MLSNLYYIALNVGCVFILKWIFDVFTCSKEPKRQHNWPEWSEVKERTVIHENPYGPQYEPDSVFQYKYQVRYCLKCHEYQERRVW